ncbi:hypothetical protein K439DRAFT_517761 [Ramaria rubella]|nr:hypothetical protein K439DRAFT_517761 [Ramaria rubella]
MREPRTARHGTTPIAGFRRLRVGIRTLHARKSGLCAEIRTLRGKQDSARKSGLCAEIRTLRGKQDSARETRPCSDKKTYLARVRAPRRTSHIPARNSTSSAGFKLTITPHASRRTARPSAPQTRRTNPLAPHTSPHTMHTHPSKRRDINTLHHPAHAHAHAPSSNPTLTHPPFPIYTPPTQVKGVNATATT